NMLLLDEPTNDLDVATLGALEELLESWPGCALVVSHDRYFLDRVCTSVLGFEGNGRVVRHAGGYTAYRAAREQEKAEGRQKAAAPAERTGSAALPAPAAPSVKPLTYAERIELGGLLERIEEAEQRQARAEARISEPDLYTRPADEVRRAEDER